MGDFFDFCLDILGDLVSALFDLDLGDYSFGDFLVAILVVNVFVSALVISFRRANSNVGGAARPPRSGRGSTFSNGDS